MGTEEGPSYPEHLRDWFRLEIVKSYILHELASLTDSKDKRLFEEIINALIDKCRGSDERSVEERCKEIYDLFYGLSLLFKRKFIAREITSNAYEWKLESIPLKDLEISADIMIGNSKNLRGMTMEEADKTCGNDFRNKVNEIGKEYEWKKARLANDPIIVVKEFRGNKVRYRILDGNGRALYRLYKANFNMDERIMAYVGERKDVKKEEICIPFGIPHFIKEHYTNKLGLKLCKQCK